MVATRSTAIIGIEPILEGIPSMQPLHLNAKGVGGNH